MHDIGKNRKNIAQVWGKAVHKICTTCGFSGGLYTPFLGVARDAVHKPSEQALSFTPVMPLVMHRLFELFQSVNGRVMPTIHTPYKENDKSKILKSHYLYTGGF
jgi:hypothetical protein